MISTTTSRMKMMTIRSLCACLMGTALAVSADVIELKDGSRIEGIILSEHENSLEIEVGQNDRGTIRRVLIIHSSEISSWVADKEGRVLKESGAEVNRLGGTAYVEHLLQKAEQEIKSGNYDRGINQFGDAADLAVKNVEELSPADKAEALKIRAHALRLQLAALEGKCDALDKKTDGVREELSSARKKLDKEIEDFKKDQAAFREDNDKQKIQLGERHKQTDLVKREEELLLKQYLLNERQAAVEKALGDNETEKVKTQTQIKMVEERIDQAEDAVKAAERAARTR